MPGSMRLPAPMLCGVIDKLEKQGRDAVIAELGEGRVDSSGDKIRGVGLSDPQISKLSEFLDVAEKECDDPLNAASGLLESVDVSREGIDELRTVSRYLSSMGVASGAVGIDLTIVRGLGYYTGPVFETTLLDLPDYGSIFSGGRYDNLVSRFTSQSVPGVGASIGIDRLLAALIELKALDLTSATSKVLVTVMDPERIGEYLSLLRELRDAGINAEIFSGNTKNLTKQVKYGDRVGIRLR